MRVAKVDMETFLKGNGRFLRSPKDAFRPASDPRGMSGGRFHAVSITRAVRGRHFWASGSPVKLQPLHSITLEHLS